MAKKAPRGESRKRSRSSSPWRPSTSAWIGDTQSPKPQRLTISSKVASTKTNSNARQKEEKLAKQNASRPPNTSTQTKPNILVIWGDDIGITNLSCYSDGLMGYRTPNIDRIAKEGMKFTDSYGEQSCTEGRASFI